MAKEELCGRCGDPLKYGHVCKATISMDHLNALTDAFDELVIRHDFAKCATEPDCRTCQAIKRVQTFG